MGFIYILQGSYEDMAHKCYKDRDGKIHAILPE